MNRYFIIHKPYGMLSQFSREGERQTLGDLSFDFPKDVYPLGRLDADSEGLLLLTNDKKVNHRLLNPAFGHKRTYLIQVEGEITEAGCKKIEEGVLIAVDGSKYKTEKCNVKMLPGFSMPERNPPIRTRKSIHVSWIEMTLTEGKNRQVRKMTAAAGHPTLRLIRIAIEKIKLGDLEPGEVKELKAYDVLKSLKLY